MPAQQLDHVAVLGAARRSFANRHFISAGGDHCPRICAEEGVAPDFLAALDRFQQKGILLARGKAEKGAHGGQQIRAQRPDDRDESGVAAELEEGTIVGRQHGNDRRGGEA
jgi:hypothetical protein